MAMLNGLGIQTFRLLIFLISLGLSTCTAALKSYPSVLYVWSGQDTSVKNASDFVAVIDFNENSLTYGSIIRVVPLVSDPINKIGQAKNEPHHSSISADGKYYITGGLLSFLSKQKDIFVWKINQKNPRVGPTFKCGIDGPGACTDEFQPIGGSKFLVSMMCNENAGSPGDIVVVDAATCTARSFLKKSSLIQDFNPHGYGQLRNGSILVADYVLPITLTANSTSNIVFRNTCRHIFPDGRLNQTFKFDFPTEPGKTTGLGYGIGFMELKTIPGDRYSRGFACGTNTNTLYLFGPGTKPSAVYDVSEVNGYIKRPSAGIVSIFPDGKRMIMTFQMRFVILVDITQPERPKFLRTFDFCSDRSIYNMLIRVPGTTNVTTFPKFCATNNNNTGTHVIIHPDGEDRFIVLNYFLKFGLAQFTGTRSVHAFKLNKDLTDFKYDHRFNPNFEFNSLSYDYRKTFYLLRAYPHHAQYLKI